MDFEELFSIGKYQELIEFTEQKPSSIESKFYHASALWRLGRLTEALDEAIKTVDSQTPKYWMMKYLNLIGNLYGEIGDFDTALEHYDEITKIADGTDKVTLASSLNNIGVVHFLRGNLSDALTYYKKSLTIYKQIDDKKAISNTMQNLGSVYQMRGDLDKALGYYIQSIEVLEDLDDKKSRADQLINIGVIYRERGQIEESINAFKTGLQLKMELKHDINIGEALMELIITLTDDNDIDQAMRFMNQLDIIAVNNKNEFVQLYHKFAHAVFLKTSLRNKDKVESQQLFEEIIKTNTFSFQILVKSISHLVELLILEFNALQEEIILDEISKYISQLRQITLDKQMYSTYIDIIILESKLNFSQGKFDESLEYLDVAYQTSLENDLQNYTKIIKQEMKLIQNSINEKREAYGPNEISQLMDELGVLDYLKRVQTLKNRLDSEELS